MVQRIGGQRRKTRSLLARKIRQKGKLPIRKYLQEFQPGQKVALVLEPSIAEGVFHRRFHGKTGVVLGKCGSCYEVAVMDVSKKKKLIVHPAHMKGVR
ncbi:50S ribosomal protein L21e [Candidatus Woesearchaeota archaeon]|nr:MAG: 50S ribosomal protein L21e [Candidatus Woesearchaeota archaeon]